MSVIRGTRALGRRGVLSAATAVNRRTPPRPHHVELRRCGPRGILRTLFLAVLVALVLAPSAAVASPASDAQLAQCGTQQPVASYAHIVVVMDENLSWPVLRSPSPGQKYAPYINSLMSACRTYEAAGATDPSQANYMAATQGYWA